MFLKARATKHYRSLPLHSQDPISNSPYFLLNFVMVFLGSYTMNSEKRNTSYHTKTKKKIHMLKEKLSSRVYLLIVQNPNQQ